METQNRTKTSACSNSLAYQRFQTKRLVSDKKMRAYIKRTFKRLSLQRNESEIELIINTLDCNVVQSSIIHQESLASELSDIYQSAKKGRVKKLFIDKDYFRLTRLKAKLSIIDDYINEMIQTVLKNGGDIILTTFGVNKKVAAYIS